MLLITDIEHSDAAGALGGVCSEEGGGLFGCGAWPRDRGRFRRPQAEFRGRNRRTHQRLIELWRWAEMNEA
ncbi:unnamed protein product [Lota lota]